jgi:hypothetical protein
LIELIWLNLSALAVCAVVAVLDIDVQVANRKVGRPIFGFLVLLGLLGLYTFVVREGHLPLPGYGVVLFAVVYLPFLSQSFIDLETTDRIAQRELETLLLAEDFERLRFTGGVRVVRMGKRKLRMHWESRREEEGVLIELDVHPSLLPITISRPHIASVRDQLHLNRIRDDILRHREGGAEEGR